MRSSICLLLKMIINSLLFQTALFILQTDKVVPAIDENIFSVLYSKKASRPNTPVNVIVGALILKEALNVTDDEIVEARAFDIRYQYALHTTSFEEQPISDRTLSRFRARVLSYETEHDVDLFMNVL